MNGIDPVNGIAYGPARVVPRLAAIIDRALAGSAPEAVTS